MFKKIILFAVLALFSFQIEASVVLPQLSDTSDYILDPPKGPCTPEKPVDCGDFCCQLNYRCFNNSCFITFNSVEESPGLDFFISSIASFMNFFVLAVLLCLS